eukprot:gene11609-15547_t
MLKTEAIPFNSSTHGRERRTQRDISKKDLQAAVKYGTKERGFPNPRTGEVRWKYTFADIVYITDATSTSEVTSWAVEIPLNEVVITPRMHLQIEEAQRRLHLSPSNITSHYIMVVDMSGSMKKSDMNGHRTRSRGVYYALAEEFIANHLPPLESNCNIGGGDTTYTDVVTLIEMRLTPTVIFSAEPINIATNESPHCAISIFFLSDGKPSDHSLKSKFFGGDRALEAKEAILDLIRDQTKKLGSRLSFNTVGFGMNDSDFIMLRDMTEAAKLQGCNTSFIRSNLDMTSLSTALTSIISSVTATRTLLSRIPTNDKKASSKILVETERYNDALPSIFTDYDTNWKMFSPQYGFTVTRETIEWVEENKLRQGRVVGKFYRKEWKKIEFIDPSSVGIAVATKCFGQGAERVVFKISEFTQAGRPVTSSNQYVAKSSLHVVEERKLKDWHERFVFTQIKSQTLALKFNSRLDSLGLTKEIPRIEFLDCSVYFCKNNSNKFSAAFLCEKSLSGNTYRKWNDNTGRIDGQHIKDHNFEEAIMHANNNNNVKDAIIQIDRIEEGSEDDEESDDDEEYESKKAPLKSEVLELEAKVLEVDVPQAFSHFTHVHTKRSLLVCDLQGVYNHSGKYPIFEFTDPCIHTRCRKNKSYGNTNLRSKGINNFFKTHKCNPLCSLLGIADKTYH